MTSGMNEERLPWHKPEIQQLAVTLDTRSAPGSVTDLEDGSVVGQ
jgi:hypothetical protein